MGVEVMGFESVPAPTASLAEADKMLDEKENGQLDKEAKSGDGIVFGSHENGVTKDKVSDANNFPKDASAEWPAPNKIHSFYIPKFRPFEDPKIKAQIDKADREITQRTQARTQITEKLRSKRSERSEIISQLKALGVENRQFNMMVEEKRKEMGPLQQALGKLRDTNIGGRGNGLCSSEEELNDLIHSLNYRMQHESISLQEEKQLMREIKQLEATREKVIANAAMRAKIQDSMGQKEAIQDQVKLIGVDLDGVRKDQQAVKAKIKSLKDELEIFDGEIKTLQDELTSVIEKKDKARDNIQELRKKRDDGNAHFYQNRTLLNKARELAAQKDVGALEELSLGEGEKFMSLWNSSKNFREDYEKRILPSLDSRQFSRDGRIRNPDEKPLLAVEQPVPSEMETLAKANVKRTKEEAKPAPPQQDPAPAHKFQKELVQKAPKGSANKKLNDSGSAVDHNEAPAKDNVDTDEPAQVTPPVKEKEIDPEKLKEMRREEQIAKAKQAMERKKKLAEKNAAKAAIKAQKEAEKKQRDLEKKAKKKAATSASAAYEEELTEESAELEKVDSASEVPSAVKEKVQKENVLTYRSRGKGTRPLPKPVLRRKKFTNYWYYAVPAAALLVAIILALGYRYFM